MTYQEKIDKAIIGCDELIIDTLGTYDTSDLEEIIVGLVYNHTFSSADSVQNLIYTLEKVVDTYKGKKDYEPMKCPMCEETNLTHYDYKGTHIYDCSHCAFQGLEYIENNDLSNFNEWKWENHKGETTNGK